MRAARTMRSRPTEYRALEDDGQKIIEGYFAVFDGVYEIAPGYTESIAPTAFDGALDDDVRALIDHETRLVLGRTAAGTLTLRVDAHGLWGRIVINDADVDATNLYARVQRRDVSQCSFGFDILDEEQSVDATTGAVHWLIKTVKLYEVSCVTFPAYETTSISARSDEIKEIKKRRFEAWRLEQKRRLKHGCTDAGSKKP